MNSSGVTSNLYHLSMKRLGITCKNFLLFSGKILTKVHSPAILLNCVQ